MVVYRDVQIVDAIGPLEMFARTARWLIDQGRRCEPAYTVELLAARRGPVRSSSGLELVVCRSFMEVGDGIDTLLVAGGIGAPRALSDRALVGWLRGIAPRVRRLGSVCTGAWLKPGSSMAGAPRRTGGSADSSPSGIPASRLILTRSSSVTGASTPRPVSLLEWISRSRWSRRTMDARLPWRGPTARDVPKTARWSVAVQCPTDGPGRRSPAAQRAPGVDRRASWRRPLGGGARPAGGDERS